MFLVLICRRFLCKGPLYTHCCRALTLALARLSCYYFDSFIYVWHAPPGMPSTKNRHQSQEWTILSHVYCFIQGEVIGFQVLLDSLHPCSTRASWWSHPVLQGGKLLRSSWYQFCLSFAQCETPCLDNSWEVWLLGCPSHLVIPHMVVPFDS